MIIFKISMTTLLIRKKKHYSLIKMHINRETKCSSHIVYVAIFEL